MTGTSVKDGNGAFLNSCHSHCEAQDDPNWLRVSVNGVSMRDAITAWLMSDGTDPAAKHTYVDCSYNVNGKPVNCNPTC